MVGSTSRWVSIDEERGFGIVDGETDVDRPLKRVQVRWGPSDSEDENETSMMGVRGRDEYRDEGPPDDSDEFNMYEKTTMTPIFEDDGPMIGDVKDSSHIFWVPFS